MMIKFGIAGDFLRNAIFATANVYLLVQKFFKKILFIKVNAA